MVGTLLREPRVTDTPPSEAFYLLGWWWEGEHVIVPQLIEEKRIAAELERAFGEKTWTHFGSFAVAASGISEKFSWSFPKPPSTLS